MENIQIFDDHFTLSKQATELIHQLIKQKPHALICLASGDSPLLAYKLLAQKLKKEETSLTELSIIGLDEWIGIMPENPGSCAWFFNTHIIQPLELNNKQFRLFDGLANDRDAECQEMDIFIKTHGGIDLMVVGVGMNGHIGFNEPGADSSLYSHIIELDHVTQSVGQKYFQEETQLTHGITLGLKHVEEAKQVLILASGPKKAKIIQQTLEDPISTRVPSTLIRQHTNWQLFIDKEAASLLQDSE